MIAQPEYYMAKSKRRLCDWQLEIMFFHFAKEKFETATKLDVQFDCLIVRVHGCGVFGVKQ